MSKPERKEAVLNSDLIVDENEPIEGFGKSSSTLNMDMSQRPSPNLIVKNPYAGDTPLSSFAPMIVNKNGS